eukprot:6204339-Pleurochrysis_carterae.AAC.1
MDKATTRGQNVSATAAEHEPRGRSSPPLDVDKARELQLAARNREQQIRAHAGDAADAVYDDRVHVPFCLAWDGAGVLSKCRASNVGAAEVGVDTAHLEELGVGDHRVAKVSTHQACANKVAALQLRLLERDVGEIGVVKFGVEENSPVQAGAGHPRATKGGFRNDGTIEDGAAEIGVVEICSVEVAVGEVGVDKEAARVECGPGTDEFEARVWWR